MDANCRTVIHQCCIVHCIVSQFLSKQSIENNVDLRYVTQRFIKTSESRYDPKSGEIEFSLTVKDQPWEPTMEQEEWDPKSRTFTQVLLHYTLLFKVFLNFIYPV